MRVGNLEEFTAFSNRPIKKRKYLHVSVSNVNDYAEGGLMLGKHSG